MCASCEIPEVVTPPFVDRQRELRALNDALEAAPSVVVVEGEAGIGKTTLIERFLTSVKQARVLRASGDESETDIPFAAADQLLRTAGSEADALRHGQHVTVGLELLEVMTSEPSVVAVDDAQLIDGESLRALLFAARRLTGPAVVILTVRGSATRWLSDGWLALADVVSVARLEPEHVAELGRASGVEMTAEAATRLCAHTNGNPLHLKAVLEALPADGAWQQEARPLPVPGSYADLVRAQLDRLEPDVVALIEAAAVLGTRAPLDQVLRLAELDGPLEVLDEAIDSGFVDLNDQLLGFSHPLARAAVYASLPKGRRAALNARAAGLVADAGVALRHRAEAALVPDAGLVADLEAHARAEMARGAWSGAVSSFTTAGRLSVDPG